MKKKVITLMLLLGLTISALPSGVNAAQIPVNNTGNETTAEDGSTEGEESTAEEGKTGNTASGAEDGSGNGENGNTAEGTDGAAGTNTEESAATGAESAAESDSTTADGTTADGTKADSTAADGTKADSTTADGTAADGTTADGTTADDTALDGLDSTDGLEGDDMSMLSPLDAAPISDGWYTAEDGSVYYYSASAAVTGIYTVADEGTFYFDETGIKTTGLVTVEDALYYFDNENNGIMVTGTLKTLNGSIYYFNGDGKALKDQMKKVNGAYYYFDANGHAVKSQFVTFRGAKYYFDDSYHMVSNTTKTISGAKYCFRADGKVTDEAWKKSGDSAYYLDENGKAVTGAKTIKGNTLLFNSDGVLQTGLQTINGATYYIYDGSLGTAYTNATGWLTIGTYCYYFGSDHKALKNTIQNGYKLDSNGRSSTRYLVRQIVSAQTNSSMTNEQKINALWNWLVKNSWTYTRTYEHTASTWKWYTGWTDDFANQLITKKSGNCFRYAAGFGYMVYEATGYEVRVWQGMTPAARGGTTPHGWINVKINGSWYAYDPDLQKFQKTKKAVYGKTLVGTTAEKRIHQGKSYVTIK